MGARADDAHIADEHVDQLREFVEAGHPQQAADPRDALIVPAGRFDAMGIARLGPHAPEFQDIEDPVALSHAGLAKEDQRHPGSCH